MLNSLSLNIICSIILLPLIGSGLEQTCFNLKKAEIEKHLSTKTPYRAVANFDETPFEYPGCRATRIWSVIRHGARNPSKKVIKNARNKLMEIKDEILRKPNVEICSKQLDRLRLWHLDLTADEEKHLVAEGEDELLELAQRMQKRFPSLLQKDYNPKDFYFKYTKTQRTLKSATSFAEGLFGEEAVDNILYPTALHKDPVLRVSNA